MNDRPLGEGVLGYAAAGALVGAGAGALVARFGPTAAAAAGPAVPVLAPGRGHDMLRQAVGALQNIAASDRVAAFRNMAGQIESATRGAWAAAERQAVNATIFAGKAGEAIAFNAQGQAFRGNIGNAQQFSLTADGLVANFDKLQQVVK